MTNKFLIKSTFDDDEGRKKHFEFFKLWEALLSSETKNYAYIVYICITVRFLNNMNILDCIVHITIQSKLKMPKNRFKI